MRNREKAIERERKCEAEKERKSVSDREKALPAFILWNVKIFVSVVVALVVRTDHQQKVTFHE